MVIGSAPIPTLYPGADPRRSADVSVSWTPAGGPLASIGVQIGGVDQDMRNNTVTQTVYVASETPVSTMLSGTLVRNGSSLAQKEGWAIADAGGRVVALLSARDGAKVDFASLEGKRVEADGALVARGGDIVLVVTTLRRAADAPR